MKNIDLPNPSLAEETNTQENITPPQAGISFFAKLKAKWPIVLGALGSIAIFAAIIYGVYSYSTQQVQPAKEPTPVSQPTPTPTQTTKPTAEWKTYKSTKYSYLIKSPKEYLVGRYEARDGSYRKAIEDDERIGIYKEANSYFEDFLEIQIDDLNYEDKTLKELSEISHKENTSHFEVKEFSSLKTTKIDGTLSYEYFFTGKALFTRNWSGEVAEGEYRVVFTEKGGTVYSIYFTNTDLFNQILSTFKFLD